MLASQPWHHFGSLILSMIAFAKSATRTLRSSNPINLPHPQHTSKLLSMGPSAQGCLTTPNGFTHWAPIKNSCLFESLSTIPCSSTTILCTINHNFHSVLRCSLIVVENDLFLYRAPISCNGSYVQLTIVPKEFYNILFVAFHTNRAGCHLNSYSTLHRLHLRYYWPGMYSYIKKMCAACPGCASLTPQKENHPN